MIHEGESAETYSQDNDSDVSCPLIPYENDTYTISAFFLQLLVFDVCVFFLKNDKHDSDTDQDVFVLKPFIECL